MIGQLHYEDLQIEADPLIAEWFAEDTTPARLVEMLPQPVDEEKLRAYEEACKELEREYNEQSERKL